MRSWKLGWMLVVMGVVLAGCGDTRDTPDTTVDDDRCATDADCGPTQRCESATGQCVDREDPNPGCTADSDCTAGRTCDTATGECVVPVARDLSCAQTSDCLASELCHPTAKACVRTCVDAVDCPGSTKLCVALSSTDARKVCQCATDAQCNGDSEVCSNLDKVCAPKCAEDADCGSGRACDTGTGRCKVWGGSGAPCTGEGQSNCDYGTHYCASNTCTPVQTPTCTNYENFQGKQMLGTTGPFILYGARTVSATTDAAACGAATPRRVKVALSAYSSMTFPTTKDQLGGFFRVKVDGSVLAGASQIFSGADYTVQGMDRKRAEIIVSLCADPSSTTISSAFYFTDGNFLCHQANF